jgi:peptidoglycan hydrolase-like protein with peptidoglycan-binding domain
VVVLSTGSRAGDTVNGLSKGDYGTAVTALQKALLAWDATCLPRFGADGDFGSETEKALKAFQAAEGLPVTGVYDEATRKALTEKPTPPVDDDGTGDSELSDDPVQSIEPTGRYVEILPIHVRSAPGDQYMSLGTVQQGYRLPYQGETHQDDNGVPWHLAEYDGQNGWVCGKCSEIVQ